jgi:hypothetical protein
VCISCDIKKPLADERQSNFGSATAESRFLLYRGNLSLASDRAISAKKRPSDEEQRL